MNDTLGTRTGQEPLEKLVETQAVSVDLREGGHGLPLWGRVPPLIASRLKRGSSGPRAATSNRFPSLLYGMM